MPYTAKPQTFTAKVTEVTLGTGEYAVTLGGENVMPLYAFDAPLPHRPAIGIEVDDTGFDADLPGLAAFYEGTATAEERAARAASLPEADFVVLKLTSADPNGEDAPIDECVARAQAVAAAVDKPLAIIGSKNIEKDAQLFEALAQALQGQNVLLLSAREENYKAVAAAAGLAYNQKLGAESSVDINLAKQLNVLINQLGVKNESVVMNLGSAAVGYGFEYVASTMDRVRDAALKQNDAALQMPIITPAGEEAWSVKESLVSQDDFPEWGPREERGIQMEVQTAAASLAGGSNAVILVHPESVKTTAAFIAALV